MIKSLRILEKRNGEKVLQELYPICITYDQNNVVVKTDYEWIDVPLVKEGEDE